MAISSYASYKFSGKKATASTPSSTAQQQGTSAQATNTPPAGAITSTTLADLFGSINQQFQAFWHNGDANRLLTLILDNAAQPVQLFSESSQEKSHQRRQAIDQLQAQPGVVKVLGDMALEKYRKQELSLPELLSVLQGSDISKHHGETIYQTLTPLLEQKNPTIIENLPWLLPLWDKLGRASCQSNKKNTPRAIHHQGVLNGALEVVANKAKEHIRSSFSGYDHLGYLDFPIYMETIEKTLDESDLVQKRAILVALEQKRAFFYIHNPEVRAICDRMYVKGYCLKNGNLLPKAILNYHEAMAKAQSGLQSVQANIPEVFKDSVDRAFIQNVPHSRLFVVNDATKLDNLNHYAAERMAKLCQDYGTPLISKTIKTKEDIVGLFDELDRATQEHENPKVIALLDQSTTRKIRGDFWKKYKASVDPPLSTFLALYTPDPTQREYAPYDALATRVSTIKL